MNGQPVDSTRSPRGARTSWFAVILQPGVHAFSTASTLGLIILCSTLAAQLPGAAVPIVVAALLPAIAWYSWMMTEWRRPRTDAQQGRGERAG